MTDTVGLILVRRYLAGFYSAGQILHTLLPDYLPGNIHQQEISLPFQPVQELPDGIGQVINGSGSIAKNVQPFPESSFSLDKGRAVQW
jgi:hypothetical protein